MNDKNLLFDPKVEEPYFPRDRVPTQPLRASCDRRKEIGPARISVSDRTISDKAALCQLRESDDNGEHRYMRAVVLVTEGTPKGTAPSPQEYVEPLLVLTGEGYAVMTFDDLYTRICDALRGDRPRVVAELFTSEGHLRLLFEDGTFQEYDMDESSKSSRPH